jgi:hypothetical protein
MEQTQTIQKTKSTKLTVYLDSKMKNRIVTEPDMTKFDGNWKDLAYSIIGIYPYYKWVVS